MAQNIGTDSGWALETCLDVEWAHAIAPDAKILLVEAVSASDTDLLLAINYATSQPGVVAVSMSWGGDEFSRETRSFYENHFIKPDITFFASSGDTGSGVMWPAASANVVSVGGTTLNLNVNGTVISEIAWRNSSGGLSFYVARPAYQTSYGLNYSSRAVPDVSYNGNASTGVAVYNGTWWKMGGTSAGAPQWAAIHALGLSVTNNNLYGRARSEYSYYFRDISLGSNYDDSATTGYDLVTGLGSPLTSNFGVSLDVSPTSGPAGGLITLNGLGFTPGSSVNISYLNPITATWMPIIDNLTSASANFSYSMNAPDLIQNNQAGDNQALFDKIIFRAQDNTNNQSYNTTVPYTEMRRGLTQVSGSVATGVFGNNTDLASIAFVQNGQSMDLSGNWFNPGNASFLWDNMVNLGTAIVNGTGFFNATFQVPTTTVGPHTLTVNDKNSNFCVSLTRLPTVANDYSDVWHQSDFTINLIPDYTVNETFYRINNGPTLNLTFNGQPVISTENSNNTLEYWSTWNYNGTEDIDLPHDILTGIKLDKTVPSGSVTPNNSIVDSTAITLILNATDNISGITQMRFANENNEWTTWETYSTSKEWQLSNGDGQKTVFVEYINNAGLIAKYNCTINLVTPSPTPSSTLVPNIKPADTTTPSSTTEPSPIPSNSPTVQPSPTPQVPELNIQIVFVLPAVLTIVLALIFKIKPKKPKN
jgi:hypothetical protein